MAKSFTLKAGVVWELAAPVKSKNRLVKKLAAMRKKSFFMKIILLGFMGSGIFFLKNYATYYK